MSEVGVAAAADPLPYRRDCRHGEEGCDDSEASVAYAIKVSGAIKTDWLPAYAASILGESATCLAQPDAFSCSNDTRETPTLACTLRGEPRLMRCRRKGRRSCPE